MQHDGTGRGRTMLAAMLIVGTSLLAAPRSASTDSQPPLRSMQLGVLRSLDQTWRLSSCMDFDDWNTCSLQAFLVCRGFQIDKACAQAGDVGGDLVFGFGGDSDLPLAAPTERVDYQLTRIDRLYDRPDALVRVEAKTRRCWGRSHGPPLVCDGWVEEYFVLWAPSENYNATPLVSAWGFIAPPSNQPR